MKESRKRQILKLLSLILIPLCFAVVVIPPNLLHQHKESDLRCNRGNLEIEDDLCHVAIYHPQDVARDQCSHKNHIDHKFSKCEFCKFLNTTKTAIIFIESSIRWSVGEAPNYFSQTAEIGISHLKSDFGRAPPAL